jgi:toxin-antitoxin system PIN domain toxin
VILLDANLLLYAYDASSSQHAAAKPWLEEVLTGTDPVGLSWSTILAFLRIGTSSRVFRQPLSMAEALTIVSSWLECPPVYVLQPGERYWAILCELLVEAGVTGTLVSDAALAALASEHGAEVYTTDRDFRRFPSLRHRNPLSAD